MSAEQNRLLLVALGSYPEIIVSFEFDFHTCLSVHSSSEIAVWTLCSGGCFFKEESHKHIKKNPLVLTKVPGAWQEIDPEQEY